MTCLLTQVSAQPIAQYAANEKKIAGNKAPLQPQSSFSKSIDGISGETVVRQYIAALGGAQKLLQTQSLDFSGSINASGMQLDFSERKEAPNLDYIAVSVDKDTIMRSVFDGKTGYNQQVSQKVYLKPEEVTERNQDYLGLFNQLYYLDSNKSFTLDKIEKVTDNNQTFLKLDIAMPSGKVVSEYYALKTFLLAKTAEQNKVRDSVTTTTKIFTEYKQVNGVRFPCRIEVVKSYDGSEQRFDIVVDKTQINLPKK